MRDNLTVSRSLVAEGWIILRWLVLKSISVLIFLVAGRTTQTEHTVISLGNVVFRPKYPIRLFDSYETYCEGVPVAIDEYLALSPKTVWLDNKVVLDLGSGLGQYSRELWRRGARVVVSLDYQFEKLAWGRLKDGSPRSVVQGDAEALPFADEAFDSVFSHTVFEHIGDTQASLASIARVLKCGGVALISYNYLHHRGGHHLHPYVHFPWATWVVSEHRLCRFWSERLRHDQQHGQMGFYSQGCGITSLSDGAEIHLNRQTASAFEDQIGHAGLRIRHRLPSEALARAFPVLLRFARVKLFLMGTIYYVLEKA